MIKFAELKLLPLTTLAKMALAAAADVDAGEDKRGLLETIMRAIAAALIYHRQDRANKKCQQM